MTSRPLHAARRSAAGRLPSLAPLLACLAAALLLAGCAGGGAGSSVSVSSLAELTNPFLGPDYSAWLIGPVARIATPAEIKEYLALHDDQAAEAFIQQFWARRKPPVDPKRPFPPTSAQAVYEERAAVADKKYSEGGLLGRRTDRGTIFILYGLPSRVGFETGTRPTDPPVEVWQYAADAPLGLDGKRPDPFYRFVKRGDLTVSYIPRPGAHLQPLPPSPP